MFEPYKTEKNPFISTVLALGASLHWYKRLNSDSCTKGLQVYICQFAYPFKVNTTQK